MKLRAWTVSVALGLAVVSASGAAAAITAASPRAIRDLLDRGRYPAAESAATSLVARLETSNAPDSRIADALELLVESLAHGGKFLDARVLDAGERALAIRRRDPGRDSLDYARSLFAFATVYLKRHEDSTGAALLGQVLRIRERALGPHHPLVADALHELGWEFLALDRDAEAESLFRRATAIRDRHPDRVDRAAAESRMALAICTQVRGSPDSGLYARAVEATERAVGPDHPLLAQHLIHRAAMLRNRARYDEAAADLDRAIAIVERAFGPMNLLTCRALNGAGVNRLWSSRLDLAVPLFRRSLDIATALLGPDHLETAQQARDLGDAYHRMGDEAAARPLLEKAVEIFERRLPADDDRLAGARGILGMHYLSCGDAQKAKVALQRAVAVQRRDSVSLGLGLSLDYLAQASSDTAESFPLYRDAARIYRKVFGPDSPTAGRGWSLLGWMAARAGEYEQAVPLLQRGIEIARRTRPNGQDHGWGELALGHALRAAGRVTDATPHFERAVRIFENALGPAHTVAGMGWKELGAQLACVGEDDSAFRCVMRAEEIRRAHLRRNIRVLPEPQAMNLRGSWVSVRSAGMDMLVSLATHGHDPARIREAWDAVVRTRALVLDEMALRQRALFAQPDTMVRTLFARHDSLVHEQSRLEPAASTRAEPRAQLQRVVAERQAVDRVLAERSAGFREHERLAQVGLDEVVRSLPKGSALLAFVRHRRFVPAREGYDTAEKAPDSYTAFLVRSGGEGLRAIDLPRADALDQAVAAYRAQASGSGSNVSPGAERRYRTAGEALRRMAWDPIEPHLAGVDRVLVVGDGSLDLVSFSTLPVGSSRYLIERGPLFHYLSAERDLVPAEGASTRATGLLALGDPSFDADPGPGNSRSPDLEPTAYRGRRASCAEFSDVRFGALPQSARELDEIAGLWHDAFRGTGISSEILSGVRASEAAFKARAPGRRCIHLATHGFFLGEGCGAEPTHRGIGALKVDSPAGSAAAPSPTTSGDSPLLLSGLALAGANLRGQSGPHQDDGILTAEEIAALDLSGVEWAVLSACETGVGEVKAGEGVLGLRRGLQIAGVRTAIISLWKLDDREARHWMRRLYEARWKRGLDTPRSMRAASLSRLEEKRARGESTHPSAWGAFIAVGDWH